MIDSNKKEPCLSQRQNAMHEEQCFCNLALASGDYDSLSDREWVALCKEAADRGRDVTDPADPVTDCDE